MTLILPDQEPLNFPLGSSESPTPANSEGASCVDGRILRMIFYPLRFSSIKYVNKQGMLILNMVSKVVYEFLWV